MASDSKVAVFVHMFCVDLWPEFRTYLSNFRNVKFDLYVNLVIDTWFPAIHKEILRNYPSAQVIISENKGRDIGGLINLIQFVDLTKYESVVIMHTKKSGHLNIGDEWRNNMIKALIGSPETIKKNMWLFQNTKTGVIGHKKYLHSCLDHDTNKEKLLQLCYLMKVHPDIPNEKYIAGTIIWVKSQLLRYIKYHHSKIKMMLWAKGQGQLDGGWEHAFERLYGPLSTHLELELVGVDIVGDE